MVHCRLYLPAQSQPVTLDAVEMKSKTGAVERWDFDK
jgi:hypothetical protein